MIKLKMEYLGLMVDIQCGDENDDVHVNNRVLLSKIEDFLDQIQLYDKVNVRITSVRSEDDGRVTFSDTPVYGDTMASTGGMHAGS